MADPTRWQTQQDGRLKMADPTRWLIQQDGIRMFNYHRSGPVALFNGYIMPHDREMY